MINPIHNELFRKKEYISNQIKNIYTYDFTNGIDFNNYVLFEIENLLFIKKKYNDINYSKLLHLKRNLHFIENLEETKFKTYINQKSLNEIFYIGDYISIYNIEAENINNEFYDLTTEIKINKDTFKALFKIKFEEIEKDMIELTNTKCKNNPETDKILKKIKSYKEIEFNKEKSFNLKSNLLKEENIMRLNNLFQKEKTIKKEEFLEELQNIVTELERDRDEMLKKIKSYNDIKLSEEKYDNLYFNLSKEDNIAKLNDLFRKEEEINEEKFVKELNNIVRKLENEEIIKEFIKPKEILKIEDIKIKNKERLILMFLNDIFKEDDLKIFIKNINSRDAYYSYLKQELLFLFSMFNNNYLNVNDLIEFLNQKFDIEDIERNILPKYYNDLLSGTGKGNLGLIKNNIIEESKSKYKLSKIAFVKIIYELFSINPYNYELDLYKNTMFKKYNETYDVLTYTFQKKISYEFELKELEQEKANLLKLNKYSKTKVDNINKRINSIKTRYLPNVNAIVEEEDKRDIIFKEFGEIRTKTKKDDLELNSIIRRKVDEIEEKVKFFKIKEENYNKVVIDTIYDIVHNENDNETKFLLKIFQIYSKVIYYNKYNRDDRTSNQKFYFYDLVRFFILSIGEEYWYHTYKGVKLDKFITEFTKIAEKYDVKDFFTNKFSKICAMYYEFYSLNNHKFNIITNEDWSKTKWDFDNYPQFEPKIDYP